MSNITKAAAVVLLLLAIALGFLAYRIAVRPPPPAPAAPLAQRAQRAIATYPVVVAAKAIEAGARIDAASLKIEQWPVAPAGAYAQADKLAGETARLGIAPGEPVTANSLARGLARYLKPGERAVAIAVDEIVGAANRIAPGDNVDVFVTLERSQEVGGTQARLLQSRVRVLSYGLQSVDGPAPADEKAGTPRSNVPLVARNAMLAVPVEQVNELLLAARAGRLQLALRSPDDAGAPDPTLFPTRIPVLAARAGLTPGQKQEAMDGVNLAFAGDSLPQLSGLPPVVETHAEAPRPRTAHTGSRSVEVVRGGQAETIGY